MFTNFGIAFVLTISFKAELITLVNSLRAGHDTVVSVTNLVALSCITSSSSVSCFHRMLPGYKLILHAGRSCHSLHCNNFADTRLHHISLLSFQAKKRYMSELRTPFSFTRARHSTLCILANLDKVFCIAGHRFTRAKIAYLLPESWYCT